jgi:glycosyltransferase involved in cell wall biosynthesis
MDEPRPTISVLVPVYNKEPFVASTLTSIDRQITASKFSIEVVIVDDGSSDRSREIVAQHQWKNPDVRVVQSRTPENLGPGGTYALAFRASSGAFIVPLDADDLITRMSLLQRFEAFEADAELAWVTGNCLAMDTNGAINPGREMAKPDSMCMGVTAEGSRDELAERFLVGTLFMAIQTLMVRREALQAVGWYEEMRCCQDTSLIFALLMDGYKHRHLRDYVALYREHVLTAPDRSVFGQSLISGQTIADIVALKRRFAARLTPGLSHAFDRLIRFLEQHPLHQKAERPTTGERALAQGDAR